MPTSAILALIPLALCAPQQAGGSKTADKVPFQCDFIPKLVFGSPDGSKLPVYSCKNGETVVWLASEDFRSPTSNTDWVEKALVHLSVDDFTQLTPGSFHTDKDSVFRAVPGRTMSSPTICIKGVRVDKSPDIQDTVVPMPNLGFSNIVNWFKAKLG